MELRSIRKWISVGALCLAPHAQANPDCPYERLRAKRQAALVEALQGHTNPFPPQTKPIDMKKVALSEEQAKSVFTEWGVQFKALTPAEMKERKLRLMLDYMVRSGEYPPYEPVPGIPPPTLMEIQSVKPDPMNERGPALTHPETPALLEKLHKMGMKLYVDPTLKHTAAGGMFGPQEKALFIQPDAPFGLLAHEFSHAEVDYFKIRSLAGKIKRARAQGRDPMPLLALPEHAGFGPNRLLKVLELVDKGYTANSIDEAFAVEADVSSLKRHGFEAVVLDQEFQGPRKYAAEHRLNDLINLAAARPLTNAEHKLLGETLAGMNAIFKNLFQGKVSATLAITRYQWAENRPDAVKFLTLSSGFVAGSAAFAATAVAVNYQLGKLIIQCTNGLQLEWSWPPGGDEKKKGAEKG